MKSDSDSLWFKNKEWLQYFINRTCHFVMFAKSANSTCVIWWLCGSYDIINSSPS